MGKKMARGRKSTGVYLGTFLIIVFLAGARFHNIRNRDTQLRDGADGQRQHIAADRLRSRRG